MQLHGLFGDEQADSSYLVQNLPSLLQLFSTLLEKDFWLLEWDMRDELNFQRFRGSKFQIVGCLSGAKPR